MPCQAMQLPIIFEKGEMVGVVFGSITTATPISTNFLNFQCNQDFPFPTAEP